MKVYLTEEQVKNLTTMIAIEENVQYPYSPDKVLEVKRFLDDNFTKSTKYNGLGTDGLPSSTPIVLFKNVPQGENASSMYDYQLFNKLNQKFDYMFVGKDERQRFLAQVLRDWYNDDIGPYGSLSVNYV